MRRKTFKRKNGDSMSNKVGMCMIQNDCVYVRADLVLFKNSSIQSNTHILMIFGIFDIVHSVSSLKNVS